MAYIAKGSQNDRLRELLEDGSFRSISASERTGQCGDTNHLVYSQDGPQGKTEETGDRDLVHWQSGIPELNGPVLKKKKKNQAAIQRTTGALEKEKRGGIQQRGEERDGRGGKTQYILHPMSRIQIGESGRRSIKWSLMQETTLAELFMARFMQSTVITIYKARHQLLMIVLCRLGTMHENHRVKLTVSLNAQLDT